MANSPREMGRRTADGALVLILAVLKGLTPRVRLFHPKLRIMPDGRNKRVEKASTTPSLSDPSTGDQALSV